MTACTYGKLRKRATVEGGIEEPGYSIRYSWNVLKCWSHWLSWKGNIIAMQNLDFTVRKKKSNITLLTLNHFTQKRVWIETFITANKWVYLNNLEHFGRKARQLLLGRQEGEGWCPRETSAALELANRYPLLCLPSVEESTMQIIENRTLNILSY